ncbi:MAG: T9SS type A sorting domain-containing protein [Bacteroidota bacterium]
MKLTRSPFLPALLCLFLFLPAVQSQSLLSPVISTAGGSWRGQNVALDFNAGDLTVGTFEGQTVRLTQGFILKPEPVTTDIAEDASIPNTIALHQNFPNPFNPSTTLRFDLPRAGEVTMTIYNSLGMTVGAINKGLLPAGSHTILFNGRNLASGVYFYRLQVDGAIKAIKKMMIIK